MKRISGISGLLYSQLQGCCGSCTHILSKCDCTISVRVCMCVCARAYIEGRATL